MEQRLFIILKRTRSDGKLSGLVGQGFMDANQATREANLRTNSCSSYDYEVISRLVDKAENTYVAIRTHDKQSHRFSGIADKVFTDTVAAREEVLRLIATNPEKDYFGTFIVVKQN